MTIHSNGFIRYRHTSRNIRMEFLRESSSSSSSVGTRCEDMIHPGCEDPCNCVDPRNLGSSKWDKKLGHMKCLFSLYDKMR